MTYDLIISRVALKALRKLPADVNRRIAATIDSLREDPRPAGCVKLQSSEDLWRVRVGDYRVVYAVDDKVRIIDVRRIGHRKDIYD